MRRAADPTRLTGHPALDSILIIFRRAIGTMLAAGDMAAHTHAKCMERMCGIQVSVSALRATRGCVQQTLPARTGEREDAARRNRRIR
jgi:hypothetical protein